MKGMRESPGSVRDPDVQEAGQTDEEVAGEVLEVQDFLRSVQSRPVDQSDQD